MLEIILTVRMTKEQVQEAVKLWLSTKYGQVFGENAEYEYEYDVNEKQITSLIIVESRQQAAG